MGFKTTSSKASRGLRGSVRRPPDVHPRWTWDSSNGIAVPLDCPADQGANADPHPTDIRWTRISVALSHFVGEGSIYTRL